MKKSITPKLLLTFFTAILFSAHANAQNTITTDSILQLSTCAGGNIVIPYKTTGSYPQGSKFIAQLSDQLGQFNTPVDIGQTPFNTGFILGTIPKGANFSIFYKIRVICPNPAVIGTPCPNTLIITQIAELNQIIASPNDTVCERDSVTLTAINFASTYKWSTGETTRSIKVTKAGTYSVTTKDELSCESTTSLRIVVEGCHSGIKEKQLNNYLSVYPNPATAVINLANIEAVHKKEYQLFNSIGQVVKFGLVESNTITISELGRGAYFLRIKCGDAYYNGKFVKD